MADKIFDPIEDGDVYTFYKENKTDKVWWVNHWGVVGEHLISFDKKKIYNLFSDYPWNFTAKQKELFDKENPFGADFFKERK